jgi:hypothetical protein
MPLPVRLLLLLPCPALPCPALHGVVAGGISIPSRYTSFMAPVACTKLWTDVRAYKDREHFETPYVAKLHRCDGPVM